MLQGRAGIRLKMSTANVQSRTAFFRAPRQHITLLAARAAEPRLQIIVPRND